MNTDCLPEFLTNTEGGPDEGRIGLSTISRLVNALGKTGTAGRKYKDVQVRN